ncbi:MAG: pitrilysin family protein [Planctomycetota bacterium]
MSLLLRRRRRRRRRPVPMAGAKVTEHRLRNGMQVLFAERHGDPIVAVVTLYRVGARHETEREAGMSHFLEHMMFKGTDRHGKGEIDRLTTLLGGQNNAFTGPDHTAYWFELASDRWTTALDLEADRMRGLTLDPGEFEAERAVVLEELAMGEDDPWRQLSRRVEEAVFGRHPYGRPIIGCLDSLRRMTPADMRAYYERLYHPGNATIVVGGDFAPSTARREIRARFGAIPAGPPLAEVDAYRPPLPEPAGEARFTMRWDDQARRLCMAWPSARVGTEDDYALDIALAVLTTGRMSRLQRRLVLDAGLAVNVSTSNDTRVEGGIFWLFAECAQGVEPAELERRIDEELARLASEPVSPAELRRAKSLMKASDAYDGETVSDLAEELGEFAADADWRLAFDGGIRHDRVTAARLRETAARILAPERRTVGWCLPQDGGGGT